MLYYVNTHCLKGSQKLGGRNVKVSNFFFSVCMFYEIHHTLLSRINEDHFTPQFFSVDTITVIILRSYYDF